MSRFRSKTVPYSSRLTASWPAVNGYGSSSQTTYPAGSSDGSSDCNVLSKGEITDDLSTGWVGFRPQRRLRDQGGVSHSIRPFHVCLHKKINASVLCSKWTSNVKRYAYTSLVSWDANLVFTPKNFVYPSAPNIDWVSQTVALANSVRGLINTQSLIGVSIGEYSKTVRMIKNPFSLLIKSRRYDKQAARLASAKVLASSASNIWLEANYGWRSLYYDLKSYSTAFVRLRRSLATQQASGGLKDFHQRVVSSGTAANPSTSDSTWNAMVASDEASWYLSTTAFPYARLVYRAPMYEGCLSCCATERRLNLHRRMEAASHAIGLSADQVLSTLWELVPFSFVVDWFVNSKALLNLPSYLSAYNELSSCGVSGLGYSTKVKYSYQAQVRTIWPTTFSKPQDYERYTATPDGRPRHVKGTWGEVSVYTRTAGLPSGFGSIFQTRGLSFSQITSGLSLIVQRMIR